MKISLNVSKKVSICVKLWIAHQRRILPFYFTALLRCWDKLFNMIIKGLVLNVSVVSWKMSLLVHHHNE